MPEEMQTSKKKNAIYNPFITIIYNKNKIKRVLGHTWHYTKLNFCEVSLRLSQKGKIMWGQQIAFLRDFWSLKFILQSGAKPRSYWNQGV